MSEIPSSTDDGAPIEVPSGASARLPLNQPPEPDAPNLQLAIVSYDGRADRGTIHPEGLEGLAHMETWLSADMEIFVDLLAYR